MICIELLVFLLATLVVLQPPLSRGSEPLVDGSCAYSPIASIMVFLEQGKPCRLNPI